MINALKNKYKIHCKQKKWKRLNPHNNTWIDECTEINKVKVGNKTYGCLRVFSDSDSILKVGNYCSIAHDVTFLLGVEHNLYQLSTFPMINKICDPDYVEAFSKGDIIIEDDVWIGYGATILSGTRIGQGAVVAAGTVVSKDVPPYSIVAGVPSRVVKFRFEEEVINYMMTLDYNAVNDDLIKSHREELEIDIRQKQLEDIKKLYDWFPKK